MKHDHQISELQDDKVFALISYLFILCIIPLILKKDNKFVVFHAKQGLVIFIAEIAAFIISIVLGPFFGKIAVLTFGIASLFGILQALMGKSTPIPIVSGFAEKIIL